VVHSQCALWSAEVFVIGGAMYGVAALIRRSRGQRCAHCGRSGASLSCSSGKCGRTYHLPCAIEAGAMLAAEPYSMACPLHRGTVGPHLASSTGTQGRLLPPRVRSAPATQQETSQFTATATTTGGSASQPNAPLSRSHVRQGQHQPLQVPLPLSLQLATGRRVVLPPLVPTAAAEAATAAAPSPQQPSRASRIAADISSLPALMMLRTQPEGSHVAVSASLADASSMPPPPPQKMEATGAAAGSPPSKECGDGDGVCGGSGSGQIPQLNEEAGEPPAKRSRALSAEDGRWRGGRGADAPADSDGGNGGDVKAPPTALAPWAQGEPPVFERRMASAAAGAAGAAGISMLVNKHDNAAGMSSAHLEMSVASEGAAAVNSQTPGQAQAQAQATGSHVVKRRREAAAAADGAAAATEGGAVAAASAAASDTPQLASDREGTPAVAGQRMPMPTPPNHQQLQFPRSRTQLGQAGSAIPPLFAARAGAAVGGVPAATDGGHSSMTSDTLSLGLGLGIDPTSGLHLSHASALRLLQQHPHLGGALPEGVAAMLMAAHQNHHNSIGSNGSGGGLRLGGEVSAGSHGSTAAQTQPPRGMPGGGGRSRHHHHNHHHNHSSSQHHLGVGAGASVSTASASTATAFGRGASCRGGGGGGGGGSGEESPPPLQFHLPVPIQQHQQYSGGAAGMLVHMLPRAARNIEGLLPSRPLLHNPYVPSSGDPSADLVLSKIAHNGSREVEAELLGGTTGRVGHTGRCAVCVIQRKGKCGTESAPKKCLRRQLVALQRATGAGGAASLVALSGLSSAGGGSGVSGGGIMATDDAEEALYVDADGGGGAAAAAAAAAPALYLDDRVAAAAAEQRARERARRETWSLPLGMGSGATGKRPLPPHEQFAAT
ncbi:hypothetical protein VaNZ11_003522, partial [Volvox africanus]